MPPIAPVSAILLILFRLQMIQKVLALLSRLVLELKDRRQLPVKEQYALQAGGNRWHFSSDLFR